MPDRYVFGDFVLERSQQRLLRGDGSAVDLTPRQFSALLLFVENAGLLLDKDTLMRALWPGLVVEENNLSQAISSLRRALEDEPVGGEGPGRRYIQTVARRGFRFVASVTVDPPLAMDPLAPVAGPASIGPPTAVAPSSSTPPTPALAPDTTPPAGRVPGRRRMLHLSLASLVVGLAGVAGWASWFIRGGNAGDAGIGAAATLAVLPFKPLAAESRDELLEVGMADSLITRLSTVSGLVVRSVGSVQRYAGGEQDPVRAAQDLDVAWIIDGSLQRRGDQLRVNARLLRASDGTAAWSGSFDEKFTSVFDVQDAISTRVLQALSDNLQGGASVAALTPGAELGGTRNTEAYHLYLASSLHLQPRRPDSLRKSIALCRQAIALDPSYALAHVGLSAALRETMLAADAAPDSVREPALKAMRRALAIAPNLSAALSEHAYSLYYLEFDWPGAEREFRRALKLNPNFAQAHFGLGQLLLTQDRPDEGYVHLRRARELDPMSAFFNAMEAGFLHALGRREEARARLQRAFDIAPDFFMVHRTQAVIDLAEGRPEPAIAALRRAAEQTHPNSRPRALLGMQLARLGRHDEARTILEDLRQQAALRYVPTFSIAVLHAALGENASALDALEAAHVARDPQLVALKDDPRWAGLRREPRFTALMRTMKLDRYGPGFSPV